ncbi:FAD-dependent oxidoreductase [Pseudomonadota bacterium]
MTKQVSVDVVIFGGGIAGLWTLARLRQAGYGAILLESRALGGVQSIAAQGIIHGGTKYALTGALSDSARAIGEMPELWRDCLAGKGELDLRRVRALSQHQYLWSTQSMGSKMAGFFAGKMMRSRMASVDVADRPPLFQAPEFTGNVYRLDEPVIDVPSLMAELIRQVGDACFKVEPDSLRLDPADPCHFSIDSSSGLLNIQAERLVLAAGEGNEALLQGLGRDLPAMQRRPLHLIMARGLLPEIYAHCLGASANPRLTITSYPLGDSDIVWHLGGQVAESGVNRDEGAQIAAGKAEVAELLPWLDLSDITWASRRIDRAEIATPGGKRPDGWYAQSEQSVITVWPTKLAFAPKVAADVMACLESENERPAEADLDVLPRPQLAEPPWNEVPAWN